jgi:hypothetical protein
MAITLAGTSDAHDWLRAIAQFIQIVAVISLFIGGGLFGLSFADSAASMGHGLGLAIFCGALAAFLLGGIVCVGVDAVRRLEELQSFAARRAREADAKVP